jgi:hypothetical protein
MPDALSDEAVGLKPLSDADVGLELPDFASQMRAQMAGRNIGADNTGLTAELAAPVMAGLKPTSGVPEIMLHLATAPFTLASSFGKQLVPEETRQKLLRTRGIPGVGMALYDLAMDVVPMVIGGGEISAAAKASKIGNFLAKTVAGGFGAGAAKALPDSAKHAGEVWGDPKATAGEKLEALSPALIDLGIGAAGLSGAAMEKPAIPTEAAKATADVVTGKQLTLPPRFVPPQKPKPPKPVIPETAPEPERGESVIEEIKRRGLQTKKQIQSVFPHLSNEEAAALRNMAWGKPQVTPSKTGVEHAETIRENQRQLPATGEVGKAGEETGGDDIQRPPSGPPNAPAPLAGSGRTPPVQPRGGPAPPPPTVTPPEAELTSEPAAVTPEQARAAQGLKPIRPDVEFETVEVGRFKTDTEAERFAEENVNYRSWKKVGNEFVVYEDRPKPVAAAPPKPVEAAPAAAPEPGKAKVTKPVQQPGLAPGSTMSAGVPGPETPGESPRVGMGGAVASEFESGGGGTATGIKNRTVDLERSKRGLPPAIEPLRRSFGTVWDTAMAHIDREPEWQDNLIDELGEHARALTDEEDAALLQRQVSLQNEYGRATRELARLYDDGTTDLIPQYKAHLAAMSDQLLALYNINKRVGTETGRGLAARKMMANEDFSLAQMELGSRAAKGGRPLTESERAQIQKLHDEIKAWQEKYDQHVASATEREANLEAQLAVERLRKMPPPQAPIPPHVKVIADRIKTHFDARAAAAMNRLSGAVFSISPQVMADLADLGASKILSGASEFVGWSAEMVAALGERIKPHLQAVWDAANKAIDAQYAKTGLDRAQKQQMRVKAMPPAEQVQYYTKKIGDKLKAEKLNEITSLVQYVARIFVTQKPTIEREELIDAVHKILTDIDPSITRQKARDMISGYGDFRQLPKDVISKRLRDLKGQMQQVSKLEAMQQGAPPLKTGMERRTPSIEEIRLIKLVNEAKREFQVPVTDPATQLKSSLDTLKTRMENKAREYQDKLAAGDFTSRPRREIHLDAEALRLKNNLEKAKQQYYTELVNDRLKNRTRYEKAADTLVKWSRGFLLSGPSTLAKLTAAAFWRMVQNPLEESVGAALGQIPGIKQISERAPVEGGVNLRAESKAITEGFTSGLEDAQNTIKTGRSALDRVFGGPRDVGMGEEAEAQKSVVDFFGHVHGALKAPVKRAAFARAFEKLTAWNMRNGVDVTDPMVQTKMAIQAYKRANMDIFMQPNRYADRIRRLISSFEEKDKATGKTPVSAKTAATAARVLVPIVKVPTNIVAEAIQYVTGLMTGSIRAAQALRAGAETLKPEEADLIMRELKKGAVGNGLLLLGWFAPQMFGGFYQQGQKRKQGDVAYGGARVAGKDVPRTFLHTPAIETVQVGATARRVADSKLRKKDKTTQGLSGGAMAGALGMADDVPFINEMAETSRLFNAYERTQWLGELAKSRIVPQMLSQTAEYFDRDASGRPIKRKPATVGQALETGIPGLRQAVPVKTQKPAGIPYQRQ